eukprot:s3557_g3.t1
MRLEMKRLTQLWINLPPDEPDIPAPPLPLHSRPCNRAHAIVSRYVLMQEGEQTRLQRRFLSKVLSRPWDRPGPFYVVHLYSGRRRFDDFHYWMDQHLATYSGVEIIILSIDTAINEGMNVHGRKLWDFLLQMARSRRILSLLLGPPCETWSAARFETLEPGEPHAGLPHQASRGPRPLRLASSLWGICGLSFRELQQDEDLHYTSLRSSLSSSEAIISGMSENVVNQQESHHTW